MATRTKTPTGVETSKSAAARTLYKAGKSVAEVTREVKIGYAFAYGIATRMPHPDGGTYADHAASRRATRQVSQTGTTVEVRIVNADGKFTGTVRVDTVTGAVTKKTAKN